MLRFSFLFLILIISKPALPQDNYVALITNPEIGSNGNAQNLLEVVDSINQKPNVSHVVVLGNITANGKFDEFIWAQEILDGLMVPYFVVGGENDYLLSEGKGSEISLLWGDDKKAFYHNDCNIVCLNTILPKFSDQRYIEVETLNWLEGELTNSSSPCIMIYSFYPVSDAANSRKFFETTLNHKLFSFVGKEDKTGKDNSVFEGFYLNRNEDWGYLLISTKMDSIFIRKMLGEEIKKQNKPDIVSATFASTLLHETRNPLNVFTPENKLWSIKLDKSIQTSTVFQTDKNFCGFKDGSVICIDQFGKEKWTYVTNDRIYSSPIAEKDLLVVATNEGDLLTLNANTGNLVQVIGIGETITSEIALVDIEASGITTKAVVVGTAQGNLFCYDLYTLEPIWINQSANNGAGNLINSSIISADNKVLFQDKEGMLYCVTATNGLLLWIWKPPVRSFNPLFKSDIITKGNNIYLIDAVGNFHCVDALLGTEKWEVKNIKATGLIRINNKGEFTLPSSKNKLLIISTKLGKVVNEISLPPETKNESVTSLLQVANEIIVGFTNGSVYKTVKKKKLEKIFWQDYAPTVSLNNINGNCLITDYDGNLTMIKLSGSK